MPESYDEEFNRIRKEIDDMLGSESNNIVKFSNTDLIHPERGDNLLRSFNSEDAALQYTIANNDLTKTYAIIENDDNGKFQVYEMGNTNLNLNESQIGPGDEFRKWAGSYEEAYEYINEIGAGANYFGIVDDGSGGFEIWYIAE